MSTYIHAYSKQHTYDRMTCEDRGVFIIQLRCDERERERGRERERERLYGEYLPFSIFEEEEEG